MGILEGLISALGSTGYGAANTYNQLLDEKRRLRQQEELRKKQLETEKELRKFLADLQLQQKQKLMDLQEQQKMKTLNELFGIQAPGLQMTQPEQQQGFGFQTGIQNTLPVPEVTTQTYGGLLPEKYKNNEDVKAQVLAQLLGVKLPQPTQPQLKPIDLGDRISLINPLTGEEYQTYKKAQKKKIKNLMKVDLGDKLLLTDPETGEPVKIYPKKQKGSNAATNAKDQQFFKYLKELHRVREAKTRLMAKPVDPLLGELSPEQQQRLQQAIDELNRTEKELTSYLYNTFPDEMKKYEAATKKTYIDQIKQYLGE